MKTLYIFLILVVLPELLSAQVCDINLLKAKVCVEQNKFDSALVLLSLAGNSGLKAQLTGDSYYGKKQYGKAIENYLVADSLGVYTPGLAKSFLAINKQEKATEALRSYLKQPQKISEAGLAKDPSFAAFLRTSAGKTIWQGNWYSSSETVKNSVLALLSKRLFQEAQNELDENEGKYSPRHEFFYLQALVYEKQKLPDQALVFIEKAISLHTFSDNYFALYARLLKSNKNYNDALENISKAIKINSYQPEYYIQRGEIARLSGNYVQSEKDLKLYQELYSNEPETFHQLGLLEVAKGNYQNAMDYYDALIAKDQTHAQYFLERGNIGLTLRQIEKADGDYSLALDLKPNLKDACLNKGKTLKELNDTTGACFFWGRARDLGSSEAAKLIQANCKE